MQLKNYDIFAPALSPLSLSHPLTFLKRYCRNCYHPLPNKARFCPQCGQRDSDGKVSMKGLLGKLWNNTIHLEGKFLRTAWQLFVPGLVTTEFFKGKQDRYPHPIRLFGIVMFFFVLLLNRSLNTNGSQQSGLNFSVNDAEADTIRKEDSETYLRKMEHQVTLEDIQKNYSSLPAALQTPQTKQAVDSLLVLYGRQHGLEDFSLGQAQEADTIDINLTGRTIRIPSLDIARYEPEELIRRVGNTNWLDEVCTGGRHRLRAFRPAAKFPLVFFP